MEFSNALDILGYSTYARDLNRTTQLIDQYLNDKCMDRTFIKSGGMAEHSYIAGSDSDVMIVVTAYKVMEKNSSNVHLAGTTELPYPVPLFICRRGCNAGYCRLEMFKFQYQSICFIKRRFRGTPLDYIFSELFFDIIENQNDRYFISSKLFHDKMKPGGFASPGEFNESQFRSNGPAVTFENLDIVLCLELEYWPPEAKAWSSRERRNNWPSKELLSFLEKKVYCYVVPIGSKSSNESDFEWRISFTEIERNLIWNMNDTQFKCFVLLKMLKKDYMKCEISTYHMKNVAFWLCEDLPETFWRKDLLIICVKNGLLKLRQYVEKGFLPHYIVPDNNLFLNKNIRKPEEIKYTLKIIDEINNDLEDKLLKLFSKTYKMQIMFNYSAALLADVQSEHMVYEYCQRCYNILIFVMAINGRSFCNNMDKKFGQDGEDILPCIRLALTKLELRKCRRTKKEVDEFITKMKKESDIDYLTVALTCGIVYFECRRYSDVRNALIQKLKDKSGKRYIKHGSDATYMSLMSGDITSIATVSCKQVKNIRTDRQNLVMDFAVSYHEREYAPFPFKLQLILSGPRQNIYCNPLVLSCYMLYISVYNLDLAEEMEKTRAVFENVLCNDSHHSSHYIHLNMLGHSLYVTGDIKSAFKYFVMSVTEFPSFKNGGYYHIACMINDILQNKCKFVES